MKPETFKLFAQLCESITEASTAMNLITGHPGGAQVIKKLHKDMKLAHDLEYTEIPKISWSDLKDSYKGAWVIMRCTNGTAAIRASGGTTGSYDVVVSEGGETKGMSDSKGGNILDFVKSEVGKPIKFFVAKNTSKVTDLQRKRRERQHDAGSSGVMNQDTLVKKFKPLWARAMSAAIADIKGHVANMIKNDAFDKAKKKLDRVERLQNALEALEAGSSDASEIVRTSVNSAVLMAASHYYPDETGDITRGYSSGYSSARSEGPARLLKDLTNGDTQKLGTILGFFKRTLISG
jgi:hypothetical protein